LQSEVPDLVLTVFGIEYSPSASEMTYIVSGGALNSTHSLTPGQAASAHT